MHRKSRALRRGSVVVASTLAVAAATLSGPPAATAQPSTPTGTPAPAGNTNSPATVSLHGVGPGPHTVTLLTGDKVTLSPLGGRYSVHVQPASRQDGGPPVMVDQSTPKGLYVLPGDALAAVQAGRLDRDLFNVTYLVEHGYGDETSGQLPVIVQYPAGRTATSVHASAAALPASTPTVRLDSIHGAALHVAKKQAGQFWASVRGPQASQGSLGPSTLGAGVAKVWLDRKAHVTLDQSVPLIGAPQAWAAGYDGTGTTVGIIDTGIDFTHPDLTGKVVDSRSFLDGVPTATDDHGHGTHVASIITGTGAASGGKYKGVAPGAKLVIAKVCDSQGQCPDSAMIAGMQWIAASGVKVANMSIGGDPTDGTDPVSQAVNDLTAQTGTLFVIAAGNSGTPESVGAPGAADAALTVAATDKSDGLASFSSRGPRLDGALKPDIAAPGVQIVAARAAGTTLDPTGIVDDHYIAASGTSMATPHVTGSVAILAQEHPDWTAGQLKAALMSTSKDVGHTVYERGAGRVDVAHATSAQVVATTPNADFGLVSDPAAPPSTRDITYRNLSDSDVSLTLTAALAAGGTAANGSVHVDPTLTVPARGEATATVTLDPGGLPLGQYTGAVTATADGVSLTTPVGLDHEAPKFNLTVHTIGRDGTPIAPIFQDTLDLTGPLGMVTGTRQADPNTTVTRVPAGKVSVAVWATWIDGDSRANLGYLLDPEVDITGDTEITLDLRTASQVTFHTPTPAGPINNDFDAYYQRWTASGDPFTDHVLFLNPIGAAGKLWVTPTRPVTTGRFRFATQWTLGKPEVELSVVEPHRQALHAFESQHWFINGQYTYGGGWSDYRFFTGTQNLPVVDVGKGDSDDLAGRDLHGKLVLAEAQTSTDVFGNSTCAVRVEQIGAVRDAGAAGIIFYPGTDTSCPIPLGVGQDSFTGPLKRIGIPFTFVSTKEGLALRDQITREPVTLRVSGTAETPYTYALKPYEEGRVPESLHYTFTANQLAQVDLDIHAPTPTPMLEDHQMWKQDDEPIANFGTGLAAGGDAYVAPRSRHEWIGPLDPTVVHRRTLATTDFSTGHGVDRAQAAIYDRPARLHEQWFTGPVTPGATINPRSVEKLTEAMPNGAGEPCVMCRSDGWLSSWLTMTNGSGDRFWNDEVSAWRDFDLTFDKDGVPVPFVPGGQSLRVFDVSDDSPGTYHLAISSHPNPWTPKTDARWTWKAGPVDENNWQPDYYCWRQVAEHKCHPEPLVYVSYDLTDSLAMDNTVPAGRTHRFTVEAYHSPSQAAMPAIAGLKLWASTDDGATWIPVTVRRNHDGTFTATTSYPAYDRTTGAVSLKVEAWDAEGNRVEQTTMRGFGLRDTTRPTTAR